MHGDLNGAPEDQAELADLRWHWDLAYEINLSGGAWTARFLTGTDILSAGSAEDLRRLIRADYTSRKTALTSGGTSAGTGEVEVGPGVQALRQLRGQGVI